MPFRTVLILSCLFVAGAAEAFSQATGAVTGQVLDQTKAPLAGVIVELTNGEAVLHAVTDGRGTYWLEPAPAGPVEVTFRLRNFTVVRRAAVVVSGQWQSVDAVLCRSAPT